MPMYTPILGAGTLSDSKAYGSDRIEAQAKPTPSIDSSNHCGSRMTSIDNKPAAPSHRLHRWLQRKPIARTSSGITTAANAANPL